MSYAILRTAKLKTRANISSSAQHTYRERHTPNANPRMTKLNINNGAKSSDEILSALDKRLDGINVGDDQVLMIEYLITASPEAFKRHGGKLDDRSSYFDDAIAWIKEKHGVSNILASSLQLDERTPHLVVYVVPKIDGEIKTRKRSVIAGTNEDGSKRRETREFTEQLPARLSAAHFLDGREKLSDMQTDFAACVGTIYGLKRGIEGSTATHQRVQRHYASLNKNPPPPLLKLTENIPLTARLNPRAWLNEQIQSWNQQWMAYFENMRANAVIVEQSTQNVLATRKSAMQYKEQLDEIKASYAALERELGISIEDAAKVMLDQQCLIERLTDEVCSLRSSSDSHFSPR